MIRRAGGLTGTKWERTNYIILQYIKYYIHDYACVHMMCSYIYMYIYIQVYYRYICIWARVPKSCWWTSLSTAWGMWFQSGKAWAIAIHTQIYQGSQPSKTAWLQMSLKDTWNSKAHCFVFFGNMRCELRLVFPWLASQKKMGFQLWGMIDDLHLCWLMTQFDWLLKKCYHATS